MRIQTLAGEWEFRQADSEEWLPAQVPGGVHTDLMAAGRIPDPFVADNEKHVMWVAESDWQYRRTFTVDAAVFAEERVFRPIQLCSRPPRGMLMLGVVQRRRDSRARQPYSPQTSRPTANGPMAPNPVQTA